MRSEIQLQVCDVSVDIRKLSDHTRPNTLTIVRGGGTRTVAHKYPANWATCSNNQARSFNPALP